MINHLIKLDPDTISKLQTIDNKKLSICITGLFLAFTIHFRQGQIYLNPVYETSSDACIKGTPLALLRLLFTNETTKLLYQKAISLEGDLHLLQKVQEIIRSLDIDWEEYFSHYMGDIPSHLLGNKVRKTRESITMTLSSFQQNFIEYLQEELRYLPSKEEINDFIMDIDTLREDIDRLEARYHYLYIKKDNNP
ncbi:MAG: Ubiquinone biosynthesis accessory factor UbiJ [Legionellaceae bacterium]